MASSERSRRPARARKSVQSSDSEEEKPDLAAPASMAALGVDGAGGGEIERLAKIQEKNRKAQQKCAHMLPQSPAVSFGACEIAQRAEPASS